VAGIRKEYLSMIFDVVNDWKNPFLICTWCRKLG